MYIENLILGAGISGIACASVLNKNNTLIFEKEKYYGGLCSSFEINGFIFDHAVHFSFSKDNLVRDTFDLVDYYTHKPIAYNYYNGLWLKHPVENNLYRLNIDDKIECIKDFIERPYIDNIKNYEQWLLCTYGISIYNRFHSRYTLKYWCKNACDLSTTWINTRLNIPDIKKVLHGSFSENTGIDYYTKEMRYPQKGGYQSFLSPLLDKVNISLSKEVFKIDLTLKKVYFTDGLECGYENLISSIPLPKIIQLLDNVPLDVINASENLIATSIVLISVGFKKEDIPPHLWFYIYDEDILASRVYSPSLKSKYNVPDGCSSLQFEIYYTKEKPLTQSIDELKIHIKNVLLDMKLCDESDILFMDARVVEYGNVIFYNGMENDRSIVIDYLENNGVNLIGRFGEWKYFWSDQSFLSGIDVANIINSKSSSK